MPQYDLSPEALRTYSPDLPEPPDFDAFWTATLAETRTHDLAATFRPVETGLTAVRTFDVGFAGFGGSTVRGWLHLPAGAGTGAGTEAGARLPAVVEYVGYGGGRGLAHERILWAAAGCAYLIMDTRGQGSAWSVGDTSDPQATGDPAHPGFTTQGILDPAAYYYRRVFADAVRAVDAVRAHPAVDPRRVAVVGGSQGGALSIAAAALADGVAAAAPDVPFLSDFPRAVTLADRDPYTEIVRYLKVHKERVAAVLRTLSYFDVAILGRRASAPALFSVAFMDQICPPSTVYAAFNAYGGPKEIREYPFNDHEGGEGVHAALKLRWMADRLRA